MKQALLEMDRRRTIQQAYNKEHHITPRTIEKAQVKMDEFENISKGSALNAIHSVEEALPSAKNLPMFIKDLENQMKEAADNLNFELAATLRDKLFELKDMMVKNKKIKKGKRK